MLETIIGLPNGDFEVKPGHALFEIARNVLQDGASLPLHLRSRENRLKMRVHFNEAAKQLGIPDAELQSRLKALEAS